MSNNHQPSVISTTNHLSSQPATICHLNHQPSVISTGNHLSSRPATICHLDRSRAAFRAAQWRDPCILPLPLLVLLSSAQRFQFLDSF
jgi:hypothetical protein